MRKTLVHLLGSSQSSFYFGVSLMYATNSDKAARADPVTSSLYNYKYAVVHPAPIGGKPSWSFPTDL